MAGSNLSVGFCGPHRMLRIQVRVTRSGLPQYLAPPDRNVRCGKPKAQSGGGCPAQDMRWARMCPFPSVVRQARLGPSRYSNVQISTRCVFASDASESFRMRSLYSVRTEPLTGRFHNHYRGSRKSEGVVPAAPGPCPLRYAAPACRFLKQSVRVGIVRQAHKCHRQGRSIAHQRPIDC